MSLPGYLLWVWPWRKPVCQSWILGHRLLQDGSFENILQKRPQGEKAGDQFKILFQHGRNKAVLPWVFSTLCYTLLFLHFQKFATKMSILGHTLYFNFIKEYYIFSSWSYTNQMPFCRISLLNQRKFGQSQVCRNVGSRPSKSQPPWLQRRSTAARANARVSIR